MVPVPMTPLPTAAPPNQVGPAPADAGPSAEGLADGPIAHRLRPSRTVSPQGTTRSSTLYFILFLLYTLYLVTVAWDGRLAVHNLRKSVQKMDTKPAE